MSKVILINPFKVQEGKEKEFLSFWEEAAGYMERQAGYISTRLYRAISRDARFRFINVAEWETAEHFQAANGTKEFHDLTAPYMEVFPHYPGLYEVVRT